MFRFSSSSRILLLPSVLPIPFLLLAYFTLTVLGDFRGLFLRFEQHCLITAWHVVRGTSIDGIDEFQEHFGVLVQLL